MARGFPAAGEWGCYRRDGSQQARSPLKRRIADGNYPFTTGSPQPIHDEFRKLLPDGLELTEKKRYDYYSEVKSPETALVIATGEQRRFANLLLTIGVIKEGEQ